MKAIFLSLTCLLSFWTHVYAHSASHDSNKSVNPLGEYGMHICAFHIAKNNPKIVIETQHYCMGLRDDLFQCILLETSDAMAKAKLLGVEYVISDEAYQKLPVAEKAFWHPHDYEVREGLLALIGATQKEDKDAMKLLVKTWGKTWHTWPDPSTAYPMGEPLLMWSATHKDAVPEEMIKKRDARWGIDTNRLKEERAEYLEPAARQAR